MISMFEVLSLEDIQRHAGSNAIKAVVFDIDGTLTTGDREIIKHVVSGGTRDETPRGTWTDAWFLYF